MVLLVIVLSDDNSDCLCDHSEYNRCWVDDDNIGSHVKLIILVGLNWVDDENIGGYIELMMIILVGLN